MNIRDLEVAGCALYLGEGTKLRRDKRYPNGNVFYYALEFTNADPELVSIFVDFLERVLLIPMMKMKCQLFLYEDQDIEKLTVFWRKITRIPRSNFQKTIVVRNKKSKYKPSQYGTCKIRLNNKKKYMELNDIIIKRFGLGLSLVK